MHICETFLGIRGYKMPKLYEYFDQNRSIDLKKNEALKSGSLYHNKLSKGHSLGPGLHNSFHPTIRDGSTWSKFGARGEQ